ncbi:ATP-binding protein [Infirmifilum lucidum]|uniref:ATP-binding protein n=1 Tax=Infirmifilum lucidum TaxID=2776706 RepID=A0A7L9FIE1_9CREN|nr:ATP-binding protein [Infirmifilum lucidum]QOJ79132.1 ATP-binding protein [Infirmifilum lucidum]
MGLKSLEEEYERNRFSFVVIFGRRRVGKTFLLKQFLRDKPDSVYIYVSEMPPDELRESISWELREKVGIRVPRNPSWRDIFGGVFRASRDRRVVLAVDEFQRLVDVDRAALTELQRVIDEEAASSRLMLIASGSAVGMVERFFKGGQPLYGRATSFLKLKPFDYRTACKFLRERLGATPLESLELYAVFGGTPYYLSLLESPDWGVEAERLVLDNRSPLYYEPEFLLRTELRGSLVYFEVLRLLASGKSSFSGLAGSLKTARTSLNYYLKVLIEDMDIVERDEPVMGGRPVYRIKDNFYRFWFRYVHPNRSLLELGSKGEVLEVVKRDFQSYLGVVFQDVVREGLHMLHLPFRPWRVGSWRRAGEEIDAVAVDEKQEKAIVVEAKCRELGLREAEKVLEDLKSKARAVPALEKLYGVAALKVDGREELEERGFLVFELKDFC